MGMYDIQYPYANNKQKTNLAEYCAKKGKESVNAATFIQRDK